MKSGIYKIENIINKKYYIGQSEDLEIRIKEHKYLMSKLKENNKKLNNDIAFKNKNNVGGMMYYDTTTNSSYLMTFDTIDAGVEAFVSNLKRNYFNLGLDTIEKIQPKYAPVNATNDPYGLNEFWVSGVKAFYNDI